MQVELEELALEKNGPKSIQELRRENRTLIENVLIGTDTVGPRQGEGGLWAINKVDVEEAILIEGEGHGQGSTPPNSKPRRRRSSAGAGAGASDLLLLDAVTSVKDSAQGLAKIGAAQQTLTLCAYWSTRWRGRVRRGIHWVVDFPYLEDGDITNTNNNSNNNSSANNNNINVSVSANVSPSGSNNNSGKADNASLSSTSLSWVAQRTATSSATSAHTHTRADNSHSQTSTFHSGTADGMGSISPKVDLDPLDHLQVGVSHPDRVELATGTDTTDTTGNTGNTGDTSTTGNGNTCACKKSVTVPVEVSLRNLYGKELLVSATATKRNPNTSDSSDGSNSSNSPIIGLRWAGKTKFLNVRVPAGGEVRLPFKCVLSRRGVFDLNCFDLRVRVGGDGEKEEEGGNREKGERGENEEERCKVVRGTAYVHVVQPDSEVE